MLKVRDVKTSGFLVVSRNPDAPSDAGGNIAKMFQRIGLLHLQDQQSGAVLSALKEQGFDQDPAMKALLTAADKGAVGIKTAALGIMQNYIQMSQQIRLLQAKRGIDGGGLINT